MNVLRSCVALAWLLHCGGAFAVSCDIDGVLAALEKDVVGDLSAEQRAQARPILLALCDEDAAAAATGAGEGAQSTEAAPDSDTDDASNSIFGIEFRRADEDSKGHDRLKKRG